MNESGIYYCLQHAIDIMRKVPDAYRWGEHIEKIPEHCVNAKCGRAGCRKVNRDFMIVTYKLMLSREKIQADIEACK